MQPDIEFAEQAFQNGSALTAAGFKVYLQAFVVRSVKTILDAFGSNRLGADQLVVLGAVLAKAFGNDGFGEEGPFSFQVLNFAVVPLGNLFQAGQLSFEQGNCFFAGCRCFCRGETNIFGGHDVFMLVLGYGALNSEHVNSELVT